MFPPLNTCTIAVIGLGYVGLPRAGEFAKSQFAPHTGDEFYRRVIGFDINLKRLKELRQGIDRTNEISQDDLYSLKCLEFTDDPALLAEADVYLVTVPTPIDSAKRPNLNPLEKACITVGSAIKTRKSTTKPIIIYESTVYPGVTTEVCVPILERESGLTFNEDFFCGYSPERINPGDKEHRLSDIVKVTSGSTNESAQWIDNFYSLIIKAGTYLAPSINVAEAAKVIENTQRDLNIALVNELALMFKKMSIDTLDVLEAAGTKWNFLPFRPGFVGGHCIGVDPYYLTHKAEQLGYHPQVVLAGRRINDGMGRWLAEQLILKMCQNKLLIPESKVLVLGLSFKENCPDLRNTKVIDLIESVRQFGPTVDVVDPWVDKEEANIEYGLQVLSAIPSNTSYDAVVLAVAHREFVMFSEEQWSSIITEHGFILDVKGIVPRSLPLMRV